MSDMPEQIRDVASTAARPSRQSLVVPQPHSNLPLVLAGGSALGLKHGSHVDFNRAAGFTDYEKALVGICHSPVDAKARMSNLLMTMAQRMEVNVEQFGDSTRSLTEVEA